MEYIIKFNKPYNFEGKEYTEIDMSDIESLTTQDLASIDKKYASSGQVDALKEMTVSYACILAAQATSKPIEFFNYLPAKEGVKLKTMVTAFLYV